MAPSTGFIAACGPKVASCTAENRKIGSHETDQIKREQESARPAIDLEATLVVPYRADRAEVCAVKSKNLQPRLQWSARSSGLALRGWSGWVLSDGGIGG